MNRDLARLAAAAGIESGYWDGLGERRDLTDATARALLGALGIEADGDVGAVASALEDEAATATLAPVVMLDTGAAPGVEITLDPGAAAKAIAWELATETGAIVHGNAQPMRLDANIVHARDGSTLARYRLELDLRNPLAPGYHCLRLPNLAARCALIVVPKACHIAPPLTAGGRSWGLAIQLYSLRSRRNWGIGDFTDLASIATLAGRAGAALVGINPLHARHLARPEEASPYAPSSRLALDPMYLDVEAIADYAGCDAVRALVAAPAFEGALATARAVRLVDYAAVAALKLPMLHLLYEHFCAHTAPADARAREFRAFVFAGGRDLERFATFETLRGRLRGPDGEIPRWHDWPTRWRDPEGAAVRDFCAANAHEIAFQHYLQWQADLQLRAAAEAARAAGMAVGLYRDLAVGASGDGAECWGDQGLFARGANTGAPPDLLNRTGQDWGLPPWIPRALAARGHAPWRAVLRANMQCAGALRIDHVMALTRLFWIPHGMPGTAGGYVRNGFEHLAGIVALESVRNGCTVIGEDLGSVPDGLREALAARGFLSYRVLLFERHWQGDGSFKRPSEYPRQALATVVTHDMATIAEYWSGGDIARRDSLGLFPDAALRDAEASRREPEREKLLDLIAGLGIAPDPAGGTDAVTSALHAAVGATQAMIALVQLDDITGERDPVNMPGTYREYPNWRRKLSMDIEDLPDDARWKALEVGMRAAGRCN